MATPYKIHVGPQDTGLLGYKQTDEAAAKASKLLEDDLEVGGQEPSERRVSDRRRNRSHGTENPGLEADVEAVPETPCFLQ